MPQLRNYQKLSGAKAQTGIVSGIRDPVAPAMVDSGRRVAGAANELNYAFEQEQRRVDTARVEDTYTKLKNDAIDLTIGDDGYQHKKGGAAVTEPMLNTYLGRLDRAYSALDSKLDNDRQKEEMKSRYELERSQLTKGILSHQLTQNGVYQGEVNKARIETGRNVAAINWNRPSVINAELVRIAAGADEYADSKGFGGTDKDSTMVRNGMRLEATSQIHEAVIESAINAGKTGYAKEWMKQHGDEIDADTKLRLGKLMETSSTREASQGHADRIWASGGSYGDKTAAARSINDPETRQATLSLVKARIAEDEAYKAKEESDALDDAMGEIAARRAAGHRPTINDVPVTTWEKMSGKGQSALLANITADSPPPKASPAYYALRQMYVADPIGFATNVDLNQFRGQITPEEIKEFIDLQEDAITGGPAGEIARTKSQIIKQGLGASGLDPKKIDTGEEEIEFQRRIDAEAEVMGRDLKPQDFRDIVDRMSIEVIRERDYIWDVKSPAGLTTVEGVPDDQVDELAKAVKDAGQPVTHDNIRLLYNHVNGVR